MGFGEFTNRLRDLFISLTPAYIGTAHQRSGTKIKADNTPVTDLDFYTLTKLRSYISAYFPSDYTLGEEDQKSEAQIAEILARENEYQWTIDGLDGTGNYRMGFNSYGGMVARRRGNQILYAAIFSPVDEVLRGNGFYYAEYGKGTWQWCAMDRKYEKLVVAPEGVLERMMVLLEGSSKKFWKPPISNLGSTITTRPSLSSSIAATIVARGKASALVTVENKPWDNWPAWLMIQEAGGIVTDWQGNPLRPENCGNMIAAANRADHETIIRVLAA